MMNQEQSKAVSFVNSYFVLADGLVSGLDSCLAENVVLDWFGKTIKGRTNVAAFMNTHKVNSRHVFNDINPTDSIGYNKKPNRRTRKLRSKIINDLSNSNHSIVEKRFNSVSTPMNEIVSTSDMSCSSSKIDAEGNHVEENDLIIELNDDDLSKVFKLENMKSTNIEEIEQKISQITLERKFNINSPREKEIKEMNTSKNVCISESSMKYIEAHGEILFSKKSRRQSRWSDSRLTSSGSSQTWRKPCSLQIAYSSQQICLLANKNTVESENSPNISETQQKLLSLSQITELSSNLIPNVNDFAGYLRNFSSTREEDTFYKAFNEHITNKKVNKLESIPRYINGQLVFEKINSDDQIDFQSSFIFNHLIHVIIYEGKSRCRMNLSQKFN